MWIVFLLALVITGLWVMAMCKVASDADKRMEDLMDKEIHNIVK
jgi:hypothetical protein